MELTDGTITLRPPARGDAEAVADGVRSSPDIARWMPWAEGYDLAKARAWIGGELDPTEHRFVVLSPAGALVGACGINQVEATNQTGNLGYWLRSDATGNGWATAATRLVARHGIDTLGLHRIEVVMAVDNEASRRVAERAGAVYEGVLRGRLLIGGVHHDAHCFAFVAGDELTP